MTEGGRLPVDGASPWRACVRGRDDVIAGAGILVDRWHVLTCAQVVASATGEGASESAPMGELIVHFPFWREPAGSSGWRVPASVPSCGWVPAGPGGLGGLALLLLGEPAPAELGPAELNGVRDRDHGPVRIFRLLESAEGGRWVDVRLDGAAEPGGERVQIAIDHPGTWRIDSAFAGAGAVDPRSGKVLGVVVAQDPALPDEGAGVLPMEAVVRYLPHLAPLLHGQVGIPGRRPPVRPGLVPERRLSDTELQTLFTRFWAVPAMPSRRARDYYLDALEKELGGRVMIGRQLDDVMDGWAVLFALLERPGTLRLMAGLLAGMHAGHPAVVRFVEFVELAFPDLLLEQSERVELEGRLIGIGWARIGAAHRYATRHFGVLPTIAPTTTGEVIRDLESRGAAGGEVPPLLLMVDDLAHGVRGVLSLDLHRWIDGVADRLQVPRVELRRRCDDAERRHAQPVAAHLVVVLTPDGLDVDRFLMSAVVTVGDEPERVVFRDEDARTLAGIEATLDDEVLPLVPEAVGGNVDALVVEFVVPERLLDIPFERWMFDRHRFARPIGLRYPVVLRSRDRIEDPTTHDLWRARTRRLHEYGRLVGEDAVHVVLRDARIDLPPVDEATAVFTRLMDAEGAVVLAVPFPPQHQGGSPDAFMAGLRAGVPAIVWARVATDPVGFRRVLDGELLAEGPADLPRQMWKYRLRHPSSIQSTPQMEDDHPPLGLVFDEATRIPHQLLRSYKFRAPGSGRRPGGSRQ